MCSYDEWSVVPGNVEIALQEKETRKTRRHLGGQGQTKRQDEKLILVVRKGRPWRAGANEKAGWEVDMRKYIYIYICS